MEDQRPAPRQCGWPALPGPANRITFLDAQRRNRRALRELYVLGALAVVVLAAATGLLLEATAGFGLAFLAHAKSMLVAAVARPITLTPEWAPVLSAFAAASTIAVIGYWLIVLSLLRCAGTQAAVSMFGGRPPRPADFEETQLVNIVEEMAIAAGIGPPDLLLFDSRECNMAAFGLTPDSGTILVSRGLLDRFDRDETQGCLAHMIASLGNGDTGAILALHAAGHALGLPAMLLVAPFDRRTRRMLLDVIRLRRGPSKATERDIATAAMVFAGGRASRDQRSRRAILVALGAVLLLPVFMWLLVVMLVVLVEMLLFVPLAMSLLRRRRLLADSMAVELTRNPDGLVRGLRRSSGEAGIPAGRWATPWCLSDTGAGAGLFTADIFGAHPQVAVRVAQLVEQGASTAAAQNGRPNSRY